MQHINGLVACSGLMGFSKHTAKQSDEEVFRWLSHYYELIGDMVSEANGKVIKFMGDAALIFFPEHSADAGVQAMLQLIRKGDRFLTEGGMPCRHHVRIHFGPVCAGPLGTRAEKYLDILGSTVNALFLLKGTGCVLTPEAFRKLNPETRKLFKKHTPPVSYIPLEQTHRD
ncbi:MAG: adenylate/guanylate cyclase domain-containing protein [Methylacidiphilales bacterium]|nr:adenylate/guanylate cyclase domain-containing protein [Candidatus Methylacidiphilales bacterium]